MRPTLFPLHRPRVGLSVSESGICLVALRRSWFRRPIVEKVLEHPLPCGVLTVSPTEPHMHDREAFTKTLCALTDHVNERTIALSLPTRAVHLGLFAFDRFSDDPKERDALITWRFREDLNLTIGDARVMMQTYPSETTTQVLAMAVRQSIVDQYEEACSSARLIPASIGVSLFQFLSLYRTLMQGHRRFCVMQWADDEFVLLTVEQGRPVFLRTRSMRPGTTDVRREIVGTLQYLAEQAAGLSETGEAPCPLYLITSQSTEVIAQLLGGELMVTVPGHRGGWQIAVVPLGWERVPAQLDGRRGSFAGLSALASVVGA